MSGQPAAALTLEEMRRIELAYVEHVGSCSGCRAMLRRCPRGEALWRRYRAARARYS